MVANVKKKVVSWFHNTLSLQEGAIPGFGNLKNAVKPGQSELERVRYYDGTGYSKWVF